jgi:hypothetical protein
MVQRLVIGCRSDRIFGSMSAGTIEVSIPGSRRFIPARRVSTAPSVWTMTTTTTTTTTTLIPTYGSSTKLACYQRFVRRGLVVFRGTTTENSMATSLFKKRPHCPSTRDRRVQMKKNGSSSIGTAGTTGTTTNNNSQRPLSEKISVVESLFVTVSLEDVPLLRENVLQSLLEPYSLAFVNYLWKIWTPCWAGKIALLMSTTTLTTTTTTNIDDHNKL